MGKNGLYPLKFKSIYKRTPWGGERLRSIFGKDIPSGEKIGESWEIAALGNDNTLVANGTYKGVSLRQLLEERRAEVLGDSVGYDGLKRFPLLIKFIDTAERLSLQVHPDDSYASSHESPREWGKTEAWYIIEAEPGAWVIRGAREGTTREGFLEALESGRLEECLNFLPVCSGDALFIPPGTLHAVGAGIVLLEVQQNSDLTYRVYDWGRPRELHQRKALEVIDFSPSEDRVRPVLLSPQPQKGELLVDCEKFIMELWDLSQPHEIRGLYTFDIITIIEGKAGIYYGEEGNLEVSPGESLLIPAKLQGYSISPRERCKVVRASLPRAR
ncbi:MAG: mannose-6-phosphate isomerase, class I [Candidatus Brocadiales bacterium]|nr:mannose-6-phosphate isomerase, class I [Candidatus Brocadiales bacterium]